MTELAWQPSLFGDRPPFPDLSYDGVVRHQLDEHSWVDHASQWLHDHDRLFDELRRDAPWQQRSRHMYDAEVMEPRLVAWWDEPLKSALPSRVEQVRETLSHHYGIPLDSVLINLYRDGKDSVAWHGDTVRRRLQTPIVCTVSIGHRRRFLLRRRGGGPTLLALEPGEGDLVVMGGRCQHDFEHTVPKQRVVGGARMSITLRHSTEAR